MGANSQRHAAPAEQDKGECASCWLHGHVPGCVLPIRRSHCCFMFQILPIFRMILRKRHYFDVLLCLPEVIGGLPEVCLGVFGDLQQPVEIRALIFKVLDRIWALDQLVPGQRFCIVNLFLSLLPRDFIVNICVLINNFLFIDHMCWLQCKYFYMPKLYIISSYNIDSSLSDHGQIFYNLA